MSHGALGDQFVPVFHATSLDKARAIAREGVRGTRSVSEPNGVYGTRSLEEALPWASYVAWNNQDTGPHAIVESRPLPPEHREEHQARGGRWVGDEFVHDTNIVVPPQHFVPARIHHVAIEGVSARLTGDVEDL